MKKVILLGSMLVACLSGFSQNKETEKVVVKHLQLPLKPLVGVQSYNCALDASSLLATFPEAPYQWGLSADYVKGLMRLDGLPYENSNADVTLTLVASDVAIVDYIIKNMATSSQTPSYKMIFKVSIDWKIKVSGKISDEIIVNTNQGEIEVTYPSEYDKYGVTNPAIPTSDALKSSYTANAEIINSKVLKTAVAATANRVEGLVQSNYSVKPLMKTVEINTFKTSKKFDATQWAKVTPIAIEALKGLSSGVSASATYEKGKEAVDFWDAQFEQLKGDAKTNDKLLEAALTNLITFLSLTNPAMIKDEYSKLLKHLDQSEGEELMKWATPLAKRFEANVQPVDYAAYGEVPALSGFKYSTKVALKNGNKLDAILVLTAPYYYHPYELASGAKFYNSKDFIAANCEISSKLEIDTKEVASYDLLGKSFVASKYTDASVLTIGSNESFMSKIVDGVVPVYVMHEIVLEENSPAVIGMGSAKYSDEVLVNSRKKPMYLMEKGNKKSVILNYSNLIEQLADCPSVVNKIKYGEYGNEPIEAKSKMGTLVRNNIHIELDEAIIMQIFTEYNTLMKR